MDRALKELKNVGDVSILGRNINNIQSTDDIILLGWLGIEIEALVNRMLESCRRKGLNINSNTKIMRITKRRQRLNFWIMIDRIPMKWIEIFKYRNTIGEDGRSEGKIKKKIGLAKTAFGSMRKRLKVWK